MDCEALEVFTVVVLHPADKVPKLVGVEQSSLAGLLKGAYSADEVVVTATAAKVTARGSVPLMVARATPVLSQEEMYLYRLTVGAVKFAPCTSTGQFKVGVIDGVDEEEVISHTLDKLEVASKVPEAALILTL